MCNRLAIAGIILVIVAITGYVYWASRDVVSSIYIVVAFLFGMVFRSIVNSQKL